MNNTCVITVAFRHPYIMHSERQEVTIKHLDPNLDYISFRDELPTKDKIVTGEELIPTFQKSLYGFKPQAIKRVKGKYDKVIWLDPSVLPITPIQVLIDALDEHPMIVIKGDNPLSKMCNQKAKNWFGVTDEEIKDVKHIGGTVYAFNFNDYRVREAFGLWETAEEDGMFGSQSEFMAGHWADEACMALAIFTTGLEFYTEEKFKFRNQKEL